MDDQFGLFLIIVCAILVVDLFWTFFGGGDDD